MLHHTLHQQSDKILFGRFVIALNAVFDQQLLLADEGYESSSSTIDLPTLLRKTPRIHHVSSIEHASFDPEPVTPQNIPQTPPRPVCRNYHSVQQMTTVHLLLEQLQPALQNTQKTKKKKRTSKQYLWPMIIGLPRKYLKEHCAFMNMAYNTGYAHTHALMGTTRFLLTKTA